MASNTYQTKLTAKDLTAAAFRSVGSRVASLGKSMAKLSAAFSVAGVGAGVALTKSSMAAIDNLAKTADKIGTTTEALGGLRHAAELSGVASNTLDMAMQRLTRRVSEAADGTGEAKDALEELGLNAVELEKLPLDTRMDMIADAMGSLDTQADKVRIAMKLFDAEGVAVVNMLGDGSAGLQEMALEAEKLGITLSRVDAAQIEAANDEVTRAKSVFIGIGNQLATEFSPIIAEVATGFRQAALDSEDFGTIGQRIAGAVVGAFADVLNAISKIETAFLQVKVMGQEVLLFYQNIKKTVAPIFDRANVNELNRQIQAVELLGHKGKLGPMEVRKEVDRLTEAYRQGKIVAEGNEFEEAFNETQAALAATRAELDELLTNPPPGDALIARFEEIKAEARRTAEALVGSGKSMTPGGDPDEVQKAVSFNEKIQKESKKRLLAFEKKNSFEQTQAVVGELGQQFSAVAANNKKMFAMNKALGIAQAIMNTSEAATLAYKSYPPPLNYVMAAGTIAAGLAQVAQIKAQSFMGGGFTGKGGRGGTGLDGYGGQLAMLHPNEVVLDTKKPGGVMPSINIVNNVDATGADDSRVQAAIEAASRETIVTIQDLMSRGRFA